MKQLISVEVVQDKIYLIRGQKVMLDKDLAGLYGILTKNLNKAVIRNMDRFPEDFMFQLTQEEYEPLRFHFGTSKRGGRRYLPYVFTEQGVAMLSSVLNTKRAILVNIAIMRTFVRLREVLSTHKELAQKLTELEHKVGQHDEAIQAVFAAIRELMTPSPETKRKIGFVTD